LTWEYAKFSRFSRWEVLLPLPGALNFDEDLLKQWYFSVLSLINFYRYYDRRVSEVNKDISGAILQRMQPGYRKVITSAQRMWVTQMDFEVCYLLLKLFILLVVGLLEVENDFFDSNAMSFLPHYQVS
jgi:hypothetical protein